MSHPVDIHVGKRIRQRRLLLKPTQQELSNQVGVKFQQMQKYETGKNRVSASRLWSIAKVLNVPVSFFFDGLEDRRTTDPTTAHLPVDILNNKEALDLLSAYFSAPENQRQRLFELVQTLSRSE
jgi:transcriptional regulator with XRE-family HTH domain